MNYVETSAKSGENVDSAFLSFAKTLKQENDIVDTSEQKKKRRL